MREVLDDLLTWWREGASVGVATVVATFRSAPRPPGASMIVGPDGTALGSGSGGCVEGAVYDEALSVVESGRSALTRYGVSDDDAFAVGLTCGGILDVFVENINRTTFPDFGELADMIANGRPVALATTIEHPDPARVGRRMTVPAVGEVIGSLGTPHADAAVRDDALGLLAAGTNAALTYGADGERRGEGMRVFVSSFAPKPRLLVFGAIDFAAAVARVGTFLGYRVTVCDARPVFATKARFPEVDEVVVDWPHRYLTAEHQAGHLDSRTVVAVLTHDPKFDVPLLEVALRLHEVEYIGAMGSRRTHEDRLARLREAGLTAAEIGRLSSPIGLDLGARTPEETAISIAAEIIAARWGGSGRPLTETRGRIHHDDSYSTSLNTATM